MSGRQTNRQAKPERDRQSHSHSHSHSQSHGERIERRDHFSSASRAPILPLLYSFKLLPARAVSAAPCNHPENYEGKEVSFCALGARTHFQEEFCSDPNTRL